MADGELTQVEAQHMESGGELIMATSQTVTTQKQHTERLMEGLMAQWSGESATAFRQAMDPFYDLCDDISRILEVLAGQVESGAQEYAKQHGMVLDLAHAMPGQIQPLKDV